MNHKFDMIPSKLTWLLILVMASCVITPCTYSQPPDTPFEIYIVVWRGCEDACGGFQDFFREEGIAANFIIRNADRDKTKLPAFVREAKELKVDLVVTWGTSVTVGMLGTLADSDSVKHITEIPAVFMIVADPVGAGIIQNYESSGRANVTGTRNRVPEEVQMKAIRAYRYFKRLGILYNTNELNSVLNLKKIRELAGKMRFELLEGSIDLDESGKPIIESVPQKIKELKDKNVSFIYVGSSSFLMRNRDYLTNSAIEQGVPIVAAYEEMARKSNALLAVASRYYNVGKLAGFQAKNILIDNIAPIDLPILSLSRYSYVINMETARKLKLYPPIAVLRYGEVEHGKSQH
jgi:putative tryptophan/tyrosine transport system substrate-binding protein